VRKTSFNPTQPNSKAKSLLSRFQALLSLNKKPVNQQQNEEFLPYKVPAEGSALMYRPTLSTTNVLDLIKLHLANKQPLSLIRANDGEGAVIGYPEFVSKQHFEKFLNLFFGKNKLSDEQKTLFVSEVRDAVSSADVIGVAGGNQVTHFTVTRAYFQHYALVSDHALICKSSIHRNLQEEGLYKDFLIGLDVIGLITCRDVGDILEDTFSIKRVVVYKVPEEAGHADNAGDVARHFPDRFEELRNTIVVEKPGMLFLVGAGPCGKVYCRWIKERGGIAIDIGSTFDAWAGKATRAYMWENKDTGKTMSGKYLLNGTPPENKTNPDKVNNKFYAVFESATRNEQALKALKKKPLSSKNYLICITPRSGSSWLCDAITKCGLLGRPGEYINSEVLRGGILKRTGADNLSDYLDAIRRLLATPNGIFGMKASWFQLAMMLEGCTLEEHFGKHLKYIHLIREDFVLQGISLYLSVNSSYFHSVQKNITDEMKQKHDGLEYSGPGIKHWIDHILRQEYGFEQFFAERKISPLRLTYEMIMARPRPTIKRIGKRLGIDPELLNNKIEAGHVKIGTERNQEWADRFREEYPNYVAFWLENRGKARDCDINN